jgi:hypothetical protein
MTLATRARHEPEENDAQLEGLLADLLDQVDAELERLIRHGLAGELRARMAKYPELATSSAPAAAPRKVDYDLLLGLSNAAYRLDEHARRA